MSDSRFTNNDIQLAGFFVRSKPILYRVGVWGTLIVEIILILIGVWYWLQYIGQSRVEGIVATRTFVEQGIARTFLYHVDSSPKSLKVEGVKVFESGDAETSYIALVENPNDQWIAHVTFNFTGTEKTSSRTMTVLPHERRVLSVYESKVKMSSVQLVYDTIQWEKINPHVVFDRAKFMSEHLQITIDTPKYVNADALVTTDRLSFAITNQSSFSYFDVQATAILYFNNDIIGVEEVTVAPFTSGHTENVEIHTKARGILPTKIEVLSHINIFDKANDKGVR